MMRSRNVYNTIIKEAIALPKKDPRPLPVKQNKTLWHRLSKKRSLKADTDYVVDRAYSILASAGFGTRVLEERVPVTKLHKHMAIHLNRLVATAIMRDGQLPMSIHVADRFLSHVDFGHGRVITLRVQLHHQPYRVNPTLGSFIVEESKDLHPHEALFKHFEFDLVPDRYPPPSGDGSTKERKER
jgi:hypothetical protein